MSEFIRNTDPNRVREEIVGIHQFFTEWVSGTSARDQATYDRRLLGHLSKNFLLVMPGGKSFDYPAFTKMMFEMHGQNPKFRIQIRDIKIRDRVGDVLLVTYEEWERDAIDSTPANNARASTMVLKDRLDTLEILLVHETWLPADVMSAGSYDF